ncbi:NUDIX hydrolase [Niveibacterium terrae]|uniref:NUDIX hydrolase n=1 Tax=Niveibacterium terrae TaxID=3373598 RepID=UPI003A8EC8D1
MLLVRKAGSRAFMQPGGKPEAGEQELVTLAREIQEELGCRIKAESARFIGRFSAPAVNEPGYVVEASVYMVQTQGTLRPEREIEEIAWLELDSPCALVLAPLTEHLILPAVRGEGLGGQSA